MRAITVRLSVSIPYTIPICFLTVLLFRNWNLSTLASSLRKRDCEEYCLKDEKNECKESRRCIYVQLKPGCSEGRGQGLGCEVCANGWADAEADGECDTDVGKCFRAVGRCCYVRQNGTWRR